MFRPRQKLFKGLPFPVVLPTVKTNELDEVEIVYEDASKATLPDVSTTRLSDLLAAGVDLKEVNTKILKPSMIVTHIVDEKSAEPAKEGDK